MNYKIFNLACIVLIAFFAAGNFLVWWDRGVVTVSDVIDVEVVRYEEVESRKIRRL